MKKNIKRVVLIVAFLFCLAIFIYCVFFYNYIPRQRQKKEEGLLIEAIGDWMESEESGQSEESIEKATEKSSSEGNEEIEEATAEQLSVSVDDEGIVHMDIINNFNIEDNKYFQRNGTYYTPDYAAGALFCGLHYEKCGIMREVFIGDEEAIKANLDMWIPCIANPYMDFEITDLVIKAHNHQEQDLSMNALKNASVGDRFNLIADSGVYIYEVTDIFAMPRLLVEATFDNDLLSYSADTCFLVTCGRENFPVNHFKYMKGVETEEDYKKYKSKDDIAEYFTEPKSSRYQDFVVEGHLVEKIPLSESEYASKKWKELIEKSQK